MSWNTNATLETAIEELITARNQPYNNGSTINVLEDLIALTRSLEQVVPTGCIGTIDSSGHIDNYSAYVNFTFKIFRDKANAT